MKVKNLRQVIKSTYLETAALGVPGRVRCRPFACAKGEIKRVAALAQQESESLSANVRMGIQFRNQQGKVQINHNWFLGYTKDEDGKLVIVPEEASIVRRIYAEYIDGASFLQIKRGLEADGILNGAGHKKWHESNIKQILTNEKYIGDALLQKTYTVNTLEKKRVANNGIAPKYYVEGSHEAIIDKDVFLRVQAEIVRRENILSVLEEDTDARISEVDAAVKQKQAELLDAGRDQERIDAIGDAIMDLRERRQNILTEAAMRKDVKDRIDDLASFLDEQTEAVTEYSETLVRRLIEKITVYDEMLVFEFKSGLQIEVET